jgi:hypothetical protein
MIFKQLPFYFIIALLFTSSLSMANNPLPTTANKPACAGENGKLRWQIWKGLTSTSMDPLTHAPNYPYSPDHEIIIKDLNTIANYEDNYGSLIKGFISVPQTGTYKFNLTGAQRALFYLSTDSSKTNLQKIAQVQKGATNATQYYKYAEQTSEDITLQTGQYYYFEVLHKATTGKDFVRVNWKTPFAADTSFKLVTKTYLYEYICEPSCPPKGTSCDDGDAATINDIQDGACNCIGTLSPANSPECVGARGSVKALYYDTISGSQISHLTNHAKYPTRPDRGERWTRLAGPDSLKNNYGARIRGYIRAPATGTYYFNITSRHRAHFKLSPSTETESATTIASVQSTSATGSYEHNKRAEQTSPPQTLQKGNFYYFDWLFKTTTGTEYTHIFWKTPNQTDTLWRFIDGSHLYQYDCEVICFPKNTPCDDGSSLTKNDKYDGQCNCIGTPCPNNDCSETPAPSPSPACDVSESYGNHAADGWLSCTQSMSPNASRGVSHWIQYDLGDTLLVGTSQIWNYNASGATGQGFKSVAIDYSLDGNNWTQLGIYDWAQASGIKGYNGFEGPNFGGIKARYLLITGLSNWDNGNCSGFSKIVFNTNTCLKMGESCDDGSILTMNDAYDANCNCTGRIAPVNLCQEDSIIQAHIPIDGKNHSAKMYIRSKAMVLPNFTVNLVAGQSVTLESGFHAAVGSEFIAAIANCTNNSLTANDSIILAQSKLGNPPTTGTILKEELSEQSFSTNTISDYNTQLSVQPSPAKDWSSIHFNLNYTSKVSLCIYDLNGKKVTCLANKNLFEKGKHFKVFPAQQLTAGMYFVSLRTEREQLTKPLVIIGL